MQARAQLTPTTRREQAWLLLVTIASIVPFVLIAIWARGNAPATWEQQLVDSFALGTDLWGSLVRALNAVGNIEIWAILVVVLAVVVVPLRGFKAGVFVGATFFVDFVATFAKLLVERGRPDTVNTQQLFGADSFGFPSGHSARAAALVGALIWVFVPARWRLPLATVGAIAAGLVMGYARVAFGVHFPLDVIGGLLLGVAWFAATAALL